MGEKFQRVEIEMTAEQQADGRREVSRYHYTGTLLVRDETVYISYEEEMEGDRYRTLLTCGDGRFTMLYIKKGYSGRRFWAYLEYPFFAAQILLFKIYLELCPCISFSLRVSHARTPFLGACCTVVFP